MPKWVPWNKLSYTCHITYKEMSLQRVTWVSQDVPVGSSPFAHGEPENLVSSSGNALILPQSGETNQIDFPIKMQKTKVSVEIGSWRVVRRGRKLWLEVPGFIPGKRNQLFEVMTQGYRVLGLWMSGVQKQPLKLWLWPVSGQENNKGHPCQRALWLSRVQLRMY